MRLFLLALRNLLRNQRRTLLTALAIVFGATAIVFLQGFVNGFLTVVIETTVLSKVGAVQVFRKGYIQSDDPLKMSMPQDPKLIARLLAIPGVLAATPRIDFDGMVSNGTESTMFMANAIDPATEYKVCPKRPQNVAPGSFPLSAEPGRESQVLIGKTLAEALGAKQGSTLTMQSAGPHAGSNALDIEVSGFLPTRHITESRRMATVNLAFAQDLLRMKGLVTEYVIGVTDLNLVDAVAARVRAELGDEYEVLTWREMDPRAREGATNIRYVLIFVAVVLFLLVASGIVNTMLMCVYERVREIGTMLAVGVRRWQVMVLFLWEAASLGLLGSILGVALGYGLVSWLERRGVLSNPPGGDPTLIYPHVGFDFLILVVGFAIAGSVLSALYPAWKAARLRPVDALRAT